MTLRKPFSLPALVATMVALALVVATPPTKAQVAPEADENAGSGGEAPSGLPLPRFASLRSAQINMRSGPGTRYPVVWTFQKRGIPIEILAEYDNWRKIRDPEGSEGWVHRHMLSGERTFLTIGGPQILRSDPSVESRPLARLEPGVIGKLLTCPRATAYCRADVGGYLGWLARDAFWGLYRDETLD
ncbi:SH3 domain-containing protein [Rhodospirillum rubrum]|uniref:SH3b domain-containing protein n=1 Tax=Rhodospirillum rubrum (strain ATCC 11170 / ATH 1.1.1 / DSM 467 / LMG 4362 / NCIMB 8255 / S1) TaxID=269796 RepID=Q2RMR2_RHORT|nr:SH3 domain-containing protein [Rhodospirillum rubrum]ABC24583.1 Protein of unknown function DUF1058 [Rhodospirillum rubrum ATCC 11170]AEO50336.1 hypothetical protein F11_19380 [Rhodospirillum rubrum F11]MBK5956315.1 hypothetical protein [Rhodospirillum rubrum]QXG80497.1 SH3 domain-containing protein [Rhodospirillum rubrum]HCF17070.1 hypothetical protein [Rhodospirillum rubrum]